MGAFRVLIANRGEIALRIIRSARALGMETVSVFSEADRQAPHRWAADWAVPLGEGPAAETYLDAEKILRAAAETRAQAVHPGYGFLSENAAFARRVEEAGLVWVGPSPENMAAFGSKHRAREEAHKAGVPLLPGTGLLSNLDDALAAARALGFPLMLKSTAGGGGIGMRLCRTEADLVAQFEATTRLAAQNFGQAGLFLERFVERARHVEVQVFGDGQGRVLTLGTRDCSLQRRNQKVLEEAPAPQLPPEVEGRLLEAAMRLASAVRYRSAGTLEFVYDVDRKEIAFLEVNTRLQVEHTVTEEIYGIDLVAWMLRLAMGDLGMFDHPLPAPIGHAIQVRLYAEDPRQEFRPSTGLLTYVAFPEGVRVDTWVESGTEITPYYDPLLAKIIVKGRDRAEALQALATALERTELCGIETNLRYLREVVRHPALAAMEHTTRWLAAFEPRYPSVRVLRSGPQTSVQDWPGRQGYWKVGVPPSGPMDELSFRVANRLVGNPESTPALECALEGPRLAFEADCWVAVTGAPCPVSLDGKPISPWRAFRVKRGQVLDLGRIEGPGMRAYVAISGGLDVPKYLGSASTFVLGRFGGHGGRNLVENDVLPLLVTREQDPEVSQVRPPEFTDTWILRVTYGPLAAPDYLLPEDVEQLFGSEWTVHFNSNRTGVRLVGPRPRWARSDGGEAGLHPSNVHDNPYVVGSVDLTGDMPILLGPDGPSLGGFVCPAVVIQADLWKLGQMRPGDRVRFRWVSWEEARQARQELDRAVSTLSFQGFETVGGHPQPPDPALLWDNRAPGNARVVIRRCGDAAVLVEFGPMALDLELRFRVQVWFLDRELNALAGIQELTPGVRSLLVQYDPTRLPEAQVVQALQNAEKRLAVERVNALPSRTVWMPLSWDDPAIRKAVEKYLQTVRPGAPWGPSNIEFIRRINGLVSEEEVQAIVFGAEYLVLGLGDVYLGAPVATPVDPRHRLVTTKYNPARTWTPENAVGIGGAYLCIYGMEGPGGYQLFGRTLPVWNRFKVTSEFPPGRPWLLDFFDRIRFYPVSAEELLRLREDFVHGRFRLRIEEGTFRLDEWLAWCESHREEIAKIRQHRQRAFKEERERWRRTGQDAFDSRVEDTPPSETNEEIPPGWWGLAAPVSGVVWRIEVREGQTVAPGCTAVILESMKTEIKVELDVEATVRGIPVREGQVVGKGQILVYLENAS